MLGLYFFEDHMKSDSFTEIHYVVCAESKAEALTLLRTTETGCWFEDDVEDKLPVVIDQNTPKGVIHRNTVYLT